MWFSRILLILYLSLSRRTYTENYRPFLFLQSVKFRISPGDGILFHSLYVSLPIQLNFGPFLYTQLNDQSVLFLFNPF